MSKVLAVMNSKGGVGKTSTAANLAGLFAAGGATVLIVDADPQGNLARDLGYAGSEADDAGAGLLAAALGAGPLRPVEGVRPGLSVVPGGPRLADLGAVVASRQAAGDPTATKVLRDLLAPLAGAFTVVVIDGPPGERVLQSCVLAAASHLLAPVRSDKASYDGLVLLAERVLEARAAGSSVELLGVLIHSLAGKGGKLERDARVDIARELGTDALTLQATVRQAPGVAADARALGRLAHELEEDVAAAGPWWQRLRSGAAAGPAPALRAGAAGVAADYALVAAEVLGLLQPGAR